MVKYLVGLFVLIPFYLFAQEQEVVFTTPEKLSSNINSDAQEVMGLLSPDGKYLFFSRAQFDENTGGFYGGQDIWVSEQLESGWRRSSNNYARFNTSSNEAIVGFADNGTTAYFMRTTYDKRVNGIYRAKRLKGEWNKGEFISIPGIESKGAIGFYMHPDEDVLLISMEASDGQGHEDLYYSLKGGDGTWTQPKNMGVVINTTGNEISPFLSKDKKRLYFSSNGHVGLGDEDIFVSERLYSSWDTWSIPKNLGDKVNSPDFDAYFTLANDSVAIFSSNRGQRLCDLYTTGLSKKQTVSSVDLKKYMLPEEMKEIMGGTMLTELVFDPGVSTLSEDKKFNLSKIANGIRYITGIKINLVVVEPKEAQDIDLSQKRLFAVLDFLKANDIGGDRITFGYEIANDGQVATDIIKLRFYK